jgi:hypothetical protein
MRRGKVSFTELQTASAEYRIARKAEESAREELKRIINQETDAGLSEQKAGDAAGVDRLTVRRWRGKL